MTAGVPAALAELFGQDGRVALVTGASSGLGAELALALASACAHVALVARRADRLTSLERRIVEAGGRATAVPADLAGEDGAEAVIRRVEERVGPIDVLVHAAGIHRGGRADRHPLEAWREVLGLDLTAAFLLARAVGSRMIDGGRSGRIIFVTSVLGRGANPVRSGAGYAAAKGGLDNLTRQLAVEWAGFGITVNALAPGYFPTEMTVDPARGEVHPGMRETIERFTPLGRLGRPEEIRGALLFLAAPSSSYVTGVVLPVDGGWTAW